MTEKRRDVDAKVIETLYLYSKSKCLFSELTLALGNCVGSDLDTISKVREGAGILETMEKGGLVEVVSEPIAKNKFQYVVKFPDPTKIDKAYKLVPHGELEKVPVFTPVPDYKSGFKMIHSECYVQNAQLNPKKHPLVFETVNKAKNIGYTIKKEILDLIPWAIKTQSHAFDDIWLLKLREARITKLREVDYIQGIASMVGDRVFYHKYFLDFRGRKYCYTSYLHEQGCDLAKSLLRLAKGEPLPNLDWLYIMLANYWGKDRGDGRNTDKIPLADRIAWAKANRYNFIRAAYEPKEFEWWTKADKPWQFLSACIEFKERTEAPKSLSYFFGFIDGTTNGSQHLVALMRDSKIAPYVNLTKQEYPGDLYQLVADNLWKELEATPTEPEDDKRVDEIIRLREEKKDTKTLREIRPDETAIAFWKRITKKKERRKIVKRNVMTLPYGGTAYGLGDQQVADATKLGIPLLYSMDKSWGIFLGRFLYNGCGRYIESSIKLLNLFKEIGNKYEEMEEYMSWKVPVTGFPVIQYYNKAKVKKVDVIYRGVRLQITVPFFEDTEYAKRKQAQGAPPNVIHSLDAAHLMMIVHACPFDVITVHDSFGCHLSHMDDLFRISRECFYELHKENRLKELFDQWDYPVPKQGDLDISQVLQSEYAFS